MGNVVTPTTDELVVAASDILSPDEIFAEGLHPIPIDPPEEIYSIPTPAEVLDNCDHFDAKNIENKIRLITESKDFPAYQWGQCVSASLNAEEILDNVVEDFNPRYHMVWGSAYYQGILAGHVWVETDVCGEMFITDFVGGTEQGQYLNFGLHYFTDKSYFNGDLESPYRSPPYVVELVTSSPVDPNSEEFKAIEEVAMGNLPLPPYVRVQRELSKLVSWLLGD
ncbi:MAG: hypothetical protein ABIC57_03215 [bacterium]